MTVNRVLDGVLPGEVAALCALTDEDHDAVGALGPVGEHLRAPHGARGVGDAVLVEPIIEGLQRIVKDEHLLLRVELLELVGVGQEVLHHSVVRNVEAVLEAEPLAAHLDLVEVLLTGVVEADVPCTHDGIGHLPEHRALARSRHAGEHVDAGGHEPLTTEGLIDPTDPTLVPLTKLCGHRDVVDAGCVSQALDVRDALELHGFLSVPFRPGCRTTLPQIVGDFHRFWSDAESSARTCSASSYVSTGMSMPAPTTYRPSRLRSTRGVALLVSNCIPSENFIMIPF